MIVYITGPSGSEIHYTTNGSTPTAESALYSRSLEQATGTTVKAIAILNGVSSAVTTYVVPSANDEPIGNDH